MKNIERDLIQKIEALESEIIERAEQYSKMIDPIAKDKLNNDIGACMTSMNRLTKKLLKIYKNEVDEPTTRETGGVHSNDRDNSLEEKTSYDGSAVI